MTPSILVVFSRLPEPGNTKTRLIPALGSLGAAALQEEMTRRTLAVAAACAAQEEVAIEVHHSGGDAAAMRVLFGSQWTYVEQERDGDLGERMLHALRRCAKQGVVRTVIIGTDCPGLSSAHLHQAFAALMEVDLVLGPARDGGYYLIGTRRPHAELFADMPWGTNRVFDLTVDRAQAAALSIALLEPLADIDRPEDLALWPELGRAAETRE